MLGGNFGVPGGGGQGGTEGPVLYADDFGGAEGENVIDRNAKDGVAGEPAVQESREPHPGNSLRNPSLLPPLVDVSRRQVG